ncbi:MAG: ABC transporter permease [Deltaproteobacteria bacterium]|nr:ABC transporter permease [Deltaproteobacteria bacterium]
MSQTRGPKVAAVVLVVIVVLAALASVIESVLGVSHTGIDLEGRYADAGFPHLLGQNELGQDLFTRLLHGARVSLAVGLLAALVATIVGLLVGMAAAFFGGVVDVVLMRFTDAMLAIPVLPLLLIAAALDVGKGSTATGAVARIVILLGAFSWMTVARLTRAQARQALALDHVAAARALGAGPWRVVVVHVLPLCLPPVVVQATLEVGGNILAESALSFLGLGVQPPVPSWGNMLMSALDVLKTDPPSALLPGCCILLTVLCVQLAGDGVRDLLDPKAKR